MGDEEDPWAIDESTETNEPQTETSQQDTLASQTEGVTSDQTDNKENAEDDLAPPPPPPEDDGYRKPVQLYRHWVRPKFLQYKYMYNYRTNYYDDVIDYLDKKQVGVPRDIPRAQTWAERVLRTSYSSGRGFDSYESSIKRDKHLIQTLAASIRPHNYHTKAYINQKYAKVL
ncbi:flightin [Calliphora vicina]|uniref:flightin n=1 Tax=Calliphora vicina TaxID=7373 RepID=UPI00325A716F